jgi:hypothetical protein
MADSIIALLNSSSKGSGGGANGRVVCSVVVLVSAVVGRSHYYTPIS